MKIRNLFHFAPAAVLAALLAAAGQIHAQVLFSTAPSYTNDFDVLATNGTANVWSDNVTMQGWYAARANGTSGAGPVTAYRAVTGNDSSGAVDSYGAVGAHPITDRALGSLSSNALGDQGYGVRFMNDTAATITNIVISYTGEQWRCNGNVTQQKLAFSFRVSPTAFTGPDIPNAAPWTAVSALDFLTLQNVATTIALDGNQSTNQTRLTAALTGTTVEPGQEVFFRWVDVNDSGNDHGIALDDLSITWSSIAANTNKPTISVQPKSQTITVGAKVTFSVVAAGKSPLSYQWYLTNNVNAGPISGANDSAYSTTFLATNDASGTYYCVITNSLGSITSSNANLTVLSAITTNIAYIRTLIDSNYDATDLLNLYSVTGVVVSPVNMVSGGTVFSFYLEDPVSHKGVDVFNRGGFAVPNQGDHVQVTSVLLNFNGLLEFNPNAANPAHSILDLDSGNPLPPPNVIDMSQTANPAYMDALEGSYIIVSNVFLSGADSFSTNGTQLTLSNNLGQLTLFAGVYAPDPQNQPVPSFCKSVRGILGQNDASLPYTSGYELLLTLYSDMETSSVVVVPPSPIPLSIGLFGTNAVLSWTNPVFSLQAAPAITGSFSTIGGASSPYTNPASGAQFFRLISP